MAKLAHSSLKSASAIPMLPKFYHDFLEEDPRLILDLLVDVLGRGAAPIEIARHLTLAAAWRVASIRGANAINDLIEPMNPFFFFNSLNLILGPIQTGP